MTEPHLPAIGDVKPIFTATPFHRRPPHPSPLTEEALQRAHRLTAHITWEMYAAALRGDFKLARALNEIR